MKLGNPIRVVNGVFQIRALGSRVTVLVGGDRALLIDAGMKGSSGLILSGLHELGLSAGSVIGVVVTHYHPDHAGGVRELVADRDITVMAHRIDARILTGAVEQPNPFQYKLMARLTAPVMEKVNGPPTQIDTELEDGDIIPFDFPVQVVHTPGSHRGQHSHLPTRPEAADNRRRAPVQAGQETHASGGSRYTRPGAGYGVAAQPPEAGLSHDLLQPLSAISRRGPRRAAPDDRHLFAVRTRRQQ